MVLNASYSHVLAGTHVLRVILAYSAYFLP
jgi:hypothetical protein